MFVFAFPRNFLTRTFRLRLITARAGCLDKKFQVLFAPGTVCVYALGFKLNMENDYYLDGRVKPDHDNFNKTQKILAQSRFRG
jgi:hypothetical protein